MPIDDNAPKPRASETSKEGAGRPPRTPAAERALAEAAARRAEKANAAAEQPNEVGGRDGPEPTRYGDWEINGLASDF
jgi:hypothetical protein